MTLIPSIQAALHHCFAMDSLNPKELVALLTSFGTMFREKAQTFNLTSMTFVI
jgi:hypothetical protein